MTRSQFRNKIRGFCWLVKKKKGLDLGEKYVENEIYGFYAIHRVIPRLYINGSTFGMAIPEEYVEPLKVKRGMPD